MLIEGGNQDFWTNLFVLGSFAGAGHYISEIDSSNLTLLSSSSSTDYGGSRNSAFLQEYCSSGENNESGAKHRTQRH